MKVTVLCPKCGETRLCHKTILFHFPDGVGRCRKCCDKDKIGVPLGIRVVSTKKGTGRARARKIYPSLGHCEWPDGCQKDATERHHKDGDTLNNARCNVQFLCRSHHMISDGRLATLLSYLPKVIRLAPAVGCRICHQPVSGLRKGRCHSCNEYFRRNGRDRPDCHEAQRGVKVIHAEPQWSKKNGVL